MSDDKIRTAEEGVGTEKAEKAERAVEAAEKDNQYKIVDEKIMLYLKTLTTKLQNKKNVEDIKSSGLSKELVKKLRKLATVRPYTRRNELLSYIIEKFSGWKLDDEYTPDGAEFVKMRKDRLTKGSVPRLTTGVMIMAGPWGALYNLIALGINTVKITADTIPKIAQKMRQSDNRSFQKLKNFISEHFPNLGMPNITIEGEVVEGEVEGEVEGGRRTKRRRTKKMNTKKVNKKSLHKRYTRKH
jgi:hypothetical protein